MGKPSSWIAGVYPEQWYCSPTQRALKMQLHPLCTLFPRLSGNEYECLKLDIKTNGLQTPITTYQGMILDGGNRYQACIDSGIEPLFVEFNGDGIGTFVLTANLHRRHLSPAQSAAIVASVQDWGKSHSVGGKGHNQYGKKEQSATNSTLLDTTKTRSNQSGASVATQRKADAVAKADPELAGKVARGEVSLNDATREVAPQLAPKKKKSAEIVGNPEENHYEEHDDCGPSDDEIKAAEQAHNELVEYVGKLMECDDPLAQALADVKMYKEESRIARERLNGIMNEKNELIRMVKSLQRKLAKSGIK